MFISRYFLCFLITFGLLGCEKSVETVSCLDDSLYGQMMVIQGGEFQFGESRYYPDEGPIQTTFVNDFKISITEVTNKEFAEFVEATGYVTDAERGLSKDEYPQIPKEYRVPGSMVFIAPEPNQPASPATWWRFIAGANWKNPYGPESSIVDMQNYPVVQISYDDALAFANWKGHRLPTEKEWEYASRGGKIGATYSWGEQDPKSGISKANTWQGMFPYENLNHDNYNYSSPVGCFPANGFGLFDTTGNVWEWTSTPYGPDRKRDYGSDGYDPQQPGVIVKTLKGGSFLCSDNYCQRYRPAARQAQDVTLATTHIGFRTVQDIE